MSAILKHTLCHLTLVVLLHQYISAQLHPNPHRARFKRAVIQDAESNGTVHPTATVEFVTLAPNVTLTSQERLEQLGRLKEAEMHLRKNLKERGKEYENQLYENWPKILQRLHDPDILSNPSLRPVLEYAQSLNLPPEQLQLIWPYILETLKSRGTQALSKMVDVIKSGGSLQHGQWLEEDQILFETTLEQEPTPEPEPTTPGTTLKKIFF